MCAYIHAFLLGSDMASIIFLGESVIPNKIKDNHRNVYSAIKWHDVAVLQKIFVLSLRNQPQNLMPTHESISDGKF